MAKEVIHVAVDKPTAKKLRDIAEGRELSLSDILREAIRQYLGSSKEQAA